MRRSEYLHVFVYLLLNACHKATIFIFNNRPLQIKPGQLITSRVKIASQTNVHESKVERVLKYFKIKQVIDQVSLGTGRLITIRNWDEYQLGEQEFEQPVNSERTASEQPVNTNKNGKKRENEENGKKKIKIFSLDSNEIRLSELLLSLINERYENYKEPNIQTWARDIDLLLRVDKRSIEDAEKIIRWSQQDSFWKDNVLSPGKLRKQYDTLWLKMQPGSNQNQKELHQPCPNDCSGSPAFTYEIVNNGITGKEICHTCLEEYARVNG